MRNSSTIHRPSVFGKPPLAGAVLAAVVAAACGDNGPAGPPQPASVAVTPGTATLIAIGDTVRFTARATDTRGGVMDGATFTWSVVDPTVASVDAQGLVTAVGRGTAQVRAAVSGGTVSGTAALTVEQAVSQVQLGIVPDSLITGESATLTASVRDANGHAVAGAMVAWSSSDPQVASVTGAGVVTAHASGTTTIRAVLAGVTAEAALAVRRPHVTLGGNAGLSGTIQARSLVVPAGVTITATGPLTFDVQERVSVLGSIRGDCTRVAIYAGGAVTIEGDIDTSCADSTATTVGSVTIAGTDSVTVSGDVVASGGVYITNDVALTDADFPPFTPPTHDPEDDDGPAASTRELRRVMGVGRAVNGDGECTVTGAQRGWDFPPATEDGTNGVGAPDQVVRCNGRLILRNATIEAGRGGRGSDDHASSASIARAEATDGGSGGNVRIEATGQVVIQGQVVLRSGEGGRGGDGTARGLPGREGPRAADAEAIGGRGGPSGTIRIAARGGVVGAPVLNHGEGGAGGNAEAFGADGRDADANGAAQAGGRAAARGGRGGSSDSGFLFRTGGNADAIGGNGGNGSAQHPNGGAGGATTAIGGQGGRARDDAGLGGRGGSISVVRGRGGDGFGACEPAFPQGGSGGPGGSIGGRVGQPGPGGPPVNIPPSMTLHEVGNGGRGGDGLVPGAGGAPGLDAMQGPKTVVTEPSLKEGPPGNPCTPPSNVSIDVTPSVITNTHNIGGDACPQPFGTFAVSNTGTVPVMIVTSPPVGVTVPPQTSPLQPGQSRTYQVLFNCQRAESFSGVIQIIANGANNAGQATAQVTVNAVVQ